MKKVLVTAIGGGGDLILGCQVTHWIQKKIGPENVELLCLARDETYEPIKLLYEDQLIVRQHELKERWGENYQLITNPLILKEEKEKYSEIYVVCPDLLFRAREYSFDFYKYNCAPQLVTQTRLLTHKYRPENIIYCAFANTTTRGYNYNNPKELIQLLATLLPNYKLYVPVLLTWNNEPIINSEKNAELQNLPPNVLVDFNPTWERALSFMSKSCYCICLDSAPLHLSYQFGIPRLILDPRFSYGRDGLMWLARWRQGLGLHDSIPIDTDFQRTAQLVTTNILIPQTQLIPRNVVLNNLNSDWSRELMIKF